MDCRATLAMTREERLAMTREERLVMTADLVAMLFVIVGGRFVYGGIAVLFIDCPVDDCFCCIYNKAFSGVVAVHNHILVGLHFSSSGAQAHLRNID